MILHPSPTTLSRYRDGDLAQAKARRIEAHLQKCRACRSRIEADRIAERVFRPAPARLDALHRGVMEKLRERPAPCRVSEGAVGIDAGGEPACSRPRKGGLLFPARWAWAGAAVLAFATALWGAWYLEKMNSSRTRDIYPGPYLMTMAQEEDCLAEPPLETRETLVPPEEAPLVPLPIELPNPVFIGTPRNIPPSPDLEPLSTAPRPPFYAPAGTRNLALGKPVTASTANVLIGNLEMITDGDKEASDANLVALDRGLQWIQIDLEEPCELYAILAWRYHAVSEIYRDVIIRTADDAEFTRNVQILFNNDRDNSAGFGAGPDKEFIETHEGKLTDAKKTRARYVRLYSNGTHSNDLNTYIEVEIWGRPLRFPEETLVPLDTYVPRRLGTDPVLVEPAPQSPHLEPLSDGPRPVFLVPEGTCNLAFANPVTSSVQPTSGDLQMITDGRKGPWARDQVKLDAGLQWVQIDLGEPCELYAVLTWRLAQIYLPPTLRSSSYQEPAVWTIYHDVIIRTADDAEFTRNVRELFNNDYDNSAGLGIGKDKEFIETYEGRLTDAKRTRARYVRLYSNGNTANGFNAYVEVEVFGRPERAIAENLVPLQTDIPRLNTWDEMTPSPKPSPHLESLVDKPRPHFFIPKDARNLAFGKPATASSRDVIIGNLGMITDGNKEPGDGNFIELMPGLQWVQIDLGEPCELHAILVWRYHALNPRIYYDVIIRTADDAQFTRNVRELFNNDYDNSSGLGAGQDKEFIESHYGRLTDAKRTRARYVRFYSNGNLWNAHNHYMEIEVWGRAFQQQAIY